MDQFLYQKYSEFHNIALSWASLRRRSEIPPKLRTISLVWATCSSGEHLLVDGNRCLVQYSSCDAAVSLSSRSQQARLLCPQGSCHPQFIKIITQATAGKLGAWNLPRFIHNCPGILGKSLHLPSPCVSWPINQRITAAFFKGYTCP